MENENITAETTKTAENTAVTTETRYTYHEIVARAAALRSQELQVIADDVVTAFEKTVMSNPHLVVPRGFVEILYDEADRNFFVKFSDRYGNLIEKKVFKRIEDGRYTLEEVWEVARRTLEL